MYSKRILYFRVLVSRVLVLFLQAPFLRVALLLSIQLVPFFVEGLLKIRMKEETFVFCVVALVAIRAVKDLGLDSVFHKHKSCFVLLDALILFFLFRYNKGLFKGDRSCRYSLVLITY